MSRPCRICGRRRALRRTKHRYCGICNERHIRGQELIELPEGHPFTEERRQRVERMRARAALGLPIFETLPPDLS